MRLANALRALLRTVSTGRADVRRGNDRRDDGAWSEAVVCYRRHLERRPGDAGIWVQLGNCAKEIGDFALADDAYSRAVALRPKAADPHLQRGHLRKLMGRYEEALGSYRDAVRCDPKNAGARSELQAAEIEAGPGDTAPPYERHARTILWLDVTDLLSHARSHPTLGGIQRVVANLAIHPVAGDPSQLCVVPVIVAYRRSAMFALDPEGVRDLVALLENGEGGRPALDRAIRHIESGRHAAVPQRGDVFIAAGAFWVHPFEDFVTMLRRRGALFCLFLHDLIQIRNPDYVSPMATVVFRRQIVYGLSLATLVLTNSRFVADEVRAFIDEYLDVDVPIEAVPLATALRPTPNTLPTPSTAVMRLAEGDFVLCVCTIEARKNHRYLLAIWQRLRQEMAAGVPRLVFVGGWGWDVADLRDAIDRSGALGDWLHIVSGITDGELDDLYRRCLFTVYVSFVEGFGLPVGESLAHGKPCIASGTSSLPEVGGDLARYVDPLNVEDGFSVIRDTLLDRPGLAAWTRRIEDTFRPRGWQDFAADLYAHASDAAVRLPTGAPLRCRVRPGEIVAIGLRAFEPPGGVPKTLVALGTARGTGWHPLEDGGAWTAAERAHLDIVSPLPEGTPVTLYLRLRRPDYSSAKSVLRIRIDNIETRLPLPAAEHFLPAKGIVGPGGAISIELIAAGAAGVTRHRYLGLSALAYCASADAATRLDLMETMMLSEAQ